MQKCEENKKFKPGENAKSIYGNRVEITPLYANGEYRVKILDDNGKYFGINEWYTEEQLEKMLTHRS